MHAVLVAGPDVGAAGASAPASAVAAWSVLTAGTTTMDTAATAAAGCGGGGNAADLQESSSSGQSRLAVNGNRRWHLADDDKLRQLVAHYGPRNWSLIARELDGRSGKSCRQRWFNVLDPRISKSPFSDEEEELLMAAHSLYGDKWAMIARHLPRRTDNAVRNQWYKIMARKHPEPFKLRRRRGSFWRPDEDAKLCEHVALYGPRNWNLIAGELGGRSAQSCRTRWLNQLDPRISKRPFSNEEEELLVLAHRFYGNKWTMIADLFPGRTDNDVKNHWHVIMARKHREQPMAGLISSSPESNTLPD